MPESLNLQQEFDKRGSWVARLVSMRPLGVALWVGGVLCLTSAWLASLTARYAVNVLWWDQWEFYATFMKPHTLWDTFVHQHGAAGMGLGLLLTELVAGVTRWDARAEAWAVVGVLVLAACTALALTRALTGRIHARDALVPMLVLTSAQYENIFGNTFAPHPVFLWLWILSACAWLIPPRRARYLVIVVLHGLTVYTAYGLLSGPLTVGLLGWEALLAYRERAEQGLAWREAALACIAAVAVLGTYAIGMHFETNVQCPKGVVSTPSDYLTFAFAQMGAFVGLSYANYPRLTTGVGSVLLLVVCGVGLWHGLRLLRAGTQRKAHDWVIVLLIGYTVIFTVTSTIGRICLGVSAAQSSRYMTFLIPAWLGVYLAGAVHTQRLWRYGLIGLAALCAVLSYAPLAYPVWIYAGGPPGTFAPESFRTAKTAWAQCYLKLHVIDTCMQAAGFPVYKYYKEPSFQQKLDYMEAQHLSFFATPSEFATGPLIITEKLQLTSDQPLAEIKPGNRIGQTFRADHDGLSGIAVQMATYTRSVTGPLYLHLRAVDDPPDAPDRALVVTEMATITDNTWVPFSFPPQADSGGRVYAVYFEAPEATEGHALTVWSARADTYAGGALQINDLRMPGDLTFGLIYSFP